MRAIAFFAGVLVATPSMAEERLIFYTANFPDATSVQLSVQSNSVSQDGTMTLRSLSAWSRRTQAALSDMKIPAGIVHAFAVVIPHM